MNIQTLALSAVFVGIIITSSVVYATTSNQKTNSISSFSLSSLSIKSDNHRRHSRRGEVLRQRREAAQRLKEDTTTIK